MLKVRRSWMLLLAVFGCVSTALSSAEAALDTQVLASTRGLLDLVEPWVRGEPRTVVLNGARLRVATGRSPESLKTLLDRAEEECRKHSAGLHARAEGLSRKHRRALPSLADGILRTETADEGMVACLDLGEATASFEDLAQRLTDFAARGDLEVLGGVRLLRAEARANEAFFVATWNEGSVPLWEMFPPEGDAPGVDFEDVPRPKNARRVLSTWQENGAPAINVYESSDAPDVLWERYTHTLEQAGWIASQHEHAQSASEHALMLVHKGHQLVITAQGQNGKTWLSVMPLDAGPGAATVAVRSNLGG